MGSGNVYFSVVAELRILLPTHVLNRKLCSEVPHARELKKLFLFVRQVYTLSLCWRDLIVPRGWCDIWIGNHGLEFRVEGWRTPSTKAEYRCVTQSTVRGGPAHK